MTSPPLRIDPVIGTLRQTANEVQLGRVLNALCGDPGVAREFCQAVVKNLVGGERRITVPQGRITCLDERVLETRLSRRRLLKRAMAAGRVDLDFKGKDGWRLVVELKIDSALGEPQLAKYMEREIPVAAVVRNPSRVSVTTDREYWVGAASWAALSGALWNLSLPDPTRSHWRSLLDVLEADGDFAETKPKVQPEAAAAVTFLSDLAPRVAEHLGAELGRTYGEGAAIAAARLTAGKVRALRGGWAGFGISTRGDGDWLFVGLRDLWGSAARVRVSLFPLQDRAAKRQLREPLSAIRSHDFEERDNGSLMLEDSLPRPEAGGDADVEAFLELKFSELVDSRVFDVDVQRQNRGT